MASSSYTLLLLLALTFFFVKPSYAEGTDPALVDKICKSTPYPDLCASTVNAGPPATDAKGVARTVVNAAVVNNKDTLKYLQSQEPDQDPLFDLVVSVCTDKYTKSDAALEKAAGIGSSVGSDVSTALSELDACRKNFEAESGPQELPKKQELIEQLLNVATKVFTFL